MADDNSTRTFDDKTIANIRDALLIGLAAFGEIERLLNAQSVQATIRASISEELQILHPTGTADAVSRFADALRALG